ncbi:MAG: MCE family protein [Rhodothermales bacterium]|nr:MCE family protein [Rhodothermales bacterium]
MKYSNEVKVGVTIVLAAIIFVLGVRYFEDLPLFKSTYSLRAEFENAGGLIAGNAVRTAGVTVGSVDGVKINPETGMVTVRFHVDDDIPVTEGTYAKIGGFDALGVVRMDLVLGPPTAPPIPEGGFVRGEPTSDMIGDLSSRAPELITRVDSVLAGLDIVLSETEGMLARPESDLRVTLANMRSSTEALESLLRGERDRIGSILANVDSVSSNVDRLTSGENAEQIEELFTSLNATLDTLDANLQGLGQTTESLNTLLAKLNDGDGTMARLINDDSMYLKLDSTLTGLNALMTDFRANPGRYMKELRLVDLF